jgi:hypothetical protein
MGWHQAGGSVRPSEWARQRAAAATLVEQTGALLPALTREVAELRGEVRVQADEFAAVRAWVEDHQRWDLAALNAIRQLGGHLDPPAPPPTHQPAPAVAPS